MKKGKANPQPRCRRCGEVLTAETRSAYRGLCWSCVDAAYAAKVEERYSREVCPAQPVGVSAEEIERTYEGWEEEE